MVKRFFGIISIAIASHSVTGQAHELGVTIGGMYYTGDLNPTVHFKNTNLAGGVHYKFNSNPRISYKLGALYGRVEAYDEDALNINQINRNLHFRSNIFELSGTVEINYLPFELGNMDKPITPFLFVGLAYFKMNPQAMWNDDWIELQPLGTEGQGTSALPGESNYSLNQISMPFGIGIKANISKKMAINAEFGFRKTWTDYLDDVSGYYANPDLLAAENGPLAAELADRSIDEDNTAYGVTGTSRGNPMTKDWYYYAGLSLSFRLDKGGVCKDAFGRKRFL